MAPWVLKFIPGWLFLFLLFASAHFIIHFFVFLQLKIAPNLFGHRFESMETFWFFYALLLIPAWVVVNYIFLYAYGHGYFYIFKGEAWKVQIMIWMSSIFVMFFTAWWRLGELPTKNAVIATIFLTGALLSIVLGKQS